MEILTIISKNLFQIYLSYSRIFFRAGIYRGFDKYRSAPISKDS